MAAKEQMYCGHASPLLYISSTKLNALYSPRQVARHISLCCARTMNVIIEEKKAKKVNNF
jgi:hypothetical protein